MKSIVLSLLQNRQKVVQALLFFVLLTLNSVSPALADITNPAIANWGGANAGAGGVDHADNLATIIAHYWIVIIQLGALAVFGYFLWGSVEWIMSSGEKSKIEAARGKMTNAVVGLVILLGLGAIVSFIQYAFLTPSGFSIFQPKFPTPLP
jgi:hypothetical protein